LYIGLVQFTFYSVNKSTVGESPPVSHKFFYKAQHMHEYVAHEYFVYCTTYTIYISKVQLHSRI
jgi:hypothetical protein